MSTVTEQFQSEMSKIQRGENPTVRPGAPIVISPAASIGDAVRQGDLYLMVSGQTPPPGFVEVPVEIQLVPGNTEGAKHCLDTGEGVIMFRNPSADHLTGPYFQATKDVTVLHPTHGSVTIPAGMCIEVHYQREWNLEQKLEQRARD